MQIFLALFILGTVLSGWTAWRRSPRYSARATWLCAGAMLVTMAVVGGVAAWVVPSLLPAITWMAIPLLIAFILLAVIGISAFILRATDGPMAKVPSSAPLVDLHRRKFHRIAKGIGIAVLLLAALDIYPPIRPVGSMFAGLLAICAVPALFGLRHKALRNDRGVSALMANPWVHWQYAQAEWEALANIQFPKQAKPAFSWKRNCGAGLLFWVNWPVRNAAQAKRRRMIAAPARAWFGPDGLLIGDDYTPWSLSGTYLLGAGVRSDPPARLVLRFYVYGGRGANVDKSVPLPEGAGHELELLQHNLHQICPRAKIAVS